MAAAGGDELEIVARRRRRAKNVALALALAGLALLFFVITIVKLTGNVS
jgi:hypothetical protein